MTAIEYAQTLINEFYPTETVISIQKAEPLSCIIICKSGRQQRVNGKWAADMLALGIQKEQTKQHLCGLL
jgi:hypothetical protein